MKHSIYCLISLLLFLMSTTISCGQDKEMKPEETEVWQPVPKKITPNGLVEKAPPSDAVILFDGSNLDKWKSKEGNKPGWQMEGNHMTIVPGTGSIQTKEKFGSMQLHVEWRSPQKVAGEGQGRGNSGVFLQSKYEVQVLDSYHNKTYSNGMAGSIYKQYIPKVNAARKPGQWQSYDITYTAPVFNSSGEVNKPAIITIYWNGVLVQDHAKLKGPTEYIGKPKYEAHGKLPLLLQDHHNPVSYRNIWVRELE